MNVMHIVWIVTMHSMGLRAWTAGYDVRVCCKKVHFNVHQVI